MRYFLLSLTLFWCTCLLAGCSGGQSASRHIADSEFSVSVWEESFQQGGSLRGVSATLTDVSADQVTLDVVCEGAAGLRNLYFDLAYDAQRFTLAAFAPRLGDPQHVLSLSDASTEGVVHCGQALLPNATGADGDFLVATLRFKRQPAVQSRASAKAPGGVGSRTMLALNGGVLSWGYYNQGDYDQNSEVNIADLTPLASYVVPPTTVTGGANGIRAVVDGDSNGEINLADLTPIGQNYGRSVKGYRVLVSESPDNYPLITTAPDIAGSTNLGEIPFASATGTSSQERLQFTFEVEVPVTHEVYYWVRPFDSADGTIGTPSQMVTGSGAPPPPLGPQAVGAYISVGFYNNDIATEQFADLAGAGVDFVIDYNLEVPDPTNDLAVRTFEAYLAIAKNNGVGVVVPLKRFLEGLTPQQGTAQLERVSEVVEQLKVYPEIEGWYINDEKLPHTNISTGGADYTISIEQMQEVYDRIRGADAAGNGGGDRPVYGTWVSLPTYNGYLQKFTAAHRPYGDPSWMASESLYNAMLTQMIQETVDIVMIDNYPVGNPSLSEGVTIEESVEIYMNRGAQLIAPGQPLYFVFQSFSWKQHSPNLAPDAQFPTAAQMESMISMAHDCGAVGVVAYNYYDLANPTASRDIPGCEETRVALLGVFDRMQDAWPQ